MQRRLLSTSMMSLGLILFVIVFPNLEALPMEHPLEAAPYTDLTSIYKSVFITPEEAQAKSAVPHTPETTFSEIIESTPATTTASPAKLEVLGTITHVGPPLAQAPADPNGTIMIQSIGVNSPIAFDVSVSDKEAYNKALETGVAHAAGTGKPMEDGNSNTFLFAHSTANEENIARYAAVFTKLDELPDGDKITIFENGIRYDYQIFKSEIVEKFDTTVLNKQYDHPTLTLQTCYPRGIPQDRYIVTAKLIGVYDR